MKWRQAPTSNLIPKMPLECVNLASVYDVMIWNWYLYWDIKSTKLATLNNSCIENDCRYERYPKYVSLWEVWLRSMPYQMRNNGLKLSIDEFLGHLKAREILVVRLSSKLPQIFVASQWLHFNHFCGDYDIKQWVQTWDFLWRLFLDKH